MKCFFSSFKDYLDLELDNKFINNNNKSNNNGSSSYSNSRDADVDGRFDKDNDDNDDDNSGVSSSCTRSSTPQSGSSHRGSLPSDSAHFGTPVGVTRARTTLCDTPSRVRFAEFETTPTCQQQQQHELIDFGQERQLYSSLQSSGRTLIDCPSVNSHTKLQNGYANYQSVSSSGSSSTTNFTLVASSASSTDRSPSARVICNSDPNPNSQPKSRRSFFKHSKSFKLSSKSKKEQNKLTRNTSDVDLEVSNDSATLPETPCQKVYQRACAKLHVLPVSSVYHHLSCSELVLPHSGIAIALVVSTGGFVSSRI